MNINKGTPSTKSISLPNTKTNVIDRARKDITVVEIEKVEIKESSEVGESPADSLSETEDESTSNDELSTGDESESIQGEGNDEKIKNDQKSNLTPRKKASTKNSKKVKSKKKRTKSKNLAGGDTKELKSGRSRKSARKKKKNLTICLNRCRYEIVRYVSKKFSLKEVYEDDDWNICWTDYSISLERALEMKRFQIINHFPGMNEICRKDLLARNLNRMKKYFNKDYDIFPKTWSLPTDLGDLQAYAASHKGKTYICKPELGCQGRGIFLLKDAKDLNPYGKIICQLYIAKPFLIDGFKFDLRIYVLITSVDPLRVYVYREGMGRFATAKYKQPTNHNTENSYMHLTNYSVNKFSEDFIVDDEAGSKRKLTAVYKWLEDRSYDIKSILGSIDDVIIKTIISAHSVLKHNYRTCFPHHDICSACFEILGFDVILDHRLKPLILEVNHSPSFHTDSQLDRDIKENLLNDTFAMLNIKRLDRNKVLRADRKRVRERLFAKHHPQNNDSSKTTKESLTTAGPPSTISQLPQSDPSGIESQIQHEMQNCGGYRLIYPYPKNMCTTSDTDAKNNSTAVGNQQDQQQQQDCIITKYNKYFEQNISLYQETAASQARAICTRNQIDEYNKKIEAERRKRCCSKKEKKELQPESGSSYLPCISIKPKLKPKKETPLPTGPFMPCKINDNDELERIRGLTNRGIQIRSMGIELQIFNLLLHNGHLKPEEEKVFRRMHLNDPHLMAHNHLNDPASLPIPNNPYNQMSMTMPILPPATAIQNQSTISRNCKEKVTPTSSSEAEIFTVGTPTISPKNSINVRSRSSYTTNDNNNNTRYPAKHFYTSSNNFNSLALYQCKR